MFELGEFTGEGNYSVFFRIRGQPELGVKVLKKTTGKYAKITLESELKKSKILLELGLPVPKYVEVIEVKVPSYFEKTLDRGIARNNPGSDLHNGSDFTNDYREKTLQTFREPLVYGLMMEYIEHDLSLISQKRLNYILKKEINHFHRYGIGVGFDVKSNRNVLWSGKEAKLYFIDFEFWNLSNIHEPIGNIRAQEKKYK